MGLTNIKKERAIIITGKHGTGKTTKALEIVPNAFVYYANVMDIKDPSSLPVDNGIIIEDLHYKPKNDVILDVLRKYRGKVVMTSINQKSVPNEIKNMAKFKRAGSKSHTRDSIKEIAPRSEEPFSFERDMFSLVNDYLKESNREKVLGLLRFNNPPDTQIINWLAENQHPNKLVFIDSVVKRRWNKEYFFEMLAYNHTGKKFGKPRMPHRKAYSKIPNICRRLGLKSGEARLLKQLIEDEDFTAYAKKKLNNGDCRLIGLGEKRTPKPRVKKMKQLNLGDF
tara:strand:- start:760 stop:1605 length:846 start_codon:yes stop_codon:yes gene_type:complete